MSPFSLFFSLLFLRFLSFSSLSLSFLLSLSLSLSFSLSPAVFLSLLGSPRHGNGFRREENSSLPIALPSRSLPLSPANSLSRSIEDWDLKLLVSIYLFIHLNREEIRRKKGSKEAPKDGMRQSFQSLYR